MNQNQLAELFDTSKKNISQHIASILEDKELDANSVVKNYFTTAADGGFKIKNSTKILFLIINIFCFSLRLHCIEEQSISIAIRLFIIIEVIFNLICVL